MPTPKQPPVIAVRLDPESGEKLRKIAEKNCRSKVAQATLFILEALKKSRAR